LRKVKLFGRFRALDIGSLLVVVTTFVLFALALFLKGLTHDILLETGVFLVSVKLILLSHESNRMKKSMDSKLNDIHDMLTKIAGSSSGTQSGH
jgi:predicted tellurium resistance membrane protein TerC